MAKDLNKIFSNQKIKPVVYRKIDIDKLRTHHIKNASDWILNEFTSLKRYFRYVHYKTQKRRCCYCRRKLNPLGINEHIDHIVARSLSIGWMFKPRNLVLSCYQCNTQKTNNQALQSGRSFKRLPRRSRYYVVFNPYFHQWQDHFEIADELFIRAKSKIGQNTIDTLKLFDYKYSIAYADEANIFGEEAIRRATKRVNLFSPNSIEYKSAKKLIDEIERHI